MNALFPMFSAPSRAGLSVSLVLLAATAGGCSRARSTVAPAAPPVVVELAPVVYSDVAVPIRVPGVLSRKTEADLSFKVGGLVENVLVRVGDGVAKDQVLAQLRLDEIDAQLALARSALEKAERDLGRVTKLQAGAVATLENLQDARTAAEMAAAQVRIAEFNRRHAVIVSPAAGHILRRTVEPNEMVAPGRVVLTFAADGEGWLVRAGLADTDVVKLAVGDRAEIAVDDGAAPPVTGRITQIAEAADPVTRTTPVEIALDAAPTAVRSGFVVPVSLHPRAMAPRVVVPAAVLIEGAGDGASVFVVEAGATVARRRAVQVEAIDGANAYLRTALPTTARLVVHGGEYLQDGASVQVAK